MSNISCPNNPKYSSMSNEFEFKGSDYSNVILHVPSHIPICLISFSLMCEGSYGCRDISIKITEVDDAILVSQSKIKDVYERFHGYIPGRFSIFISDYEDNKKVYQINMFPTAQIPLRGIKITLDIPPANNKDYKVGERAKVTYQYLILHGQV